MNTIFTFLIEVATTLIAVLLITGYLRPHLKRILVDLCSTEERAQFWIVFSNILLVGLPLILAFGYRPKANEVDELFFEVIGRLSGNLGGYLTALVGVGMVVSFFALVAPKPTQIEKK
jgi:hypothetical protein